MVRRNGTPIASIPGSFINAIRNFTRGKISA
jgi:energy-converting hydrogenase Eha subunit F